MNHEAIIELLVAACRRQVENIKRWNKTGEPAGPAESKEIYEQLVEAIKAAEEKD